MPILVYLILLWDTLSGRRPLARAADEQVPCLRIEEGDGRVRWLYESRDITRYLQGRFGARAAA